MIAYGGDVLSYSHKGTSGTITQDIKPISNGGVSFSNHGEIDLMKYYNGRRPNSYFSRVKATEKDVKSLLWLTRVKFEHYTEEDDYGD